MKYGEKEVIAIENLLYKYHVCFVCEKDWHEFMEELKKILGV